MDDPSPASGREDAPTKAINIPHRRVRSDESTGRERRSPLPACFFILFCGLSLSGCASWSKHGISPAPPARIRLAILPVRIGVHIRRLRSLGIDKPPGISRDQEAALARQELEDVSGRLRGEIEERLATSYVFDVIPASTTEQACSGLGGAGSGEEECLGLLRSRTHADAALRVTLSGYGSVKKRWIAYLIGTGIIEGTAKGVALAFAGAGPWAAAGIAAGETAQEAATWGGGSYFFGRLLSPIILEGALFSTADASRLWGKTTLAVRNRKALKKLPKEMRRKKQLRLKLSGQSAVNELASELEGAAWRQLKRLRNH